MMMGEEAAKVIDLDEGENGKKAGRVICFLLYLLNLHLKHLQSLSRSAGLAVFCGIQSS